MIGHFTKPQHSRRALVMGCAIMLFSASLFGCGPATDGPTAVGEQTLAASESESIQSFSDMQSGGTL
jgi:hypothetical protein